MDESKVLSMIADGESRNVDFKSGLELVSPRDKAEFIKDIISLANSSSGTGYLLVGVNDNKYIAGIYKLQEEQIQQVVKMYITPSLNLNCFIVPIEAPTLPLVGVIEVKATNRPHQVAKAIDKLNQDDTFVRHGTIVVKASPEEIIRMHDGSIKDEYDDANHHLTIKEEKARRLKRIRLFNYAPNYSWEEREKDLEWLKANTQGYELGEILYWEVEGWDALDLESVGLQARPLLDKAIDLGYRTPDVYFLRAEANTALCNYGLALQDIDKAISLSRPYDHVYIKYLAHKANILVEMNKFEEAFQTLEIGQKSDKEGLHSWLSLIGYGFENNLLCRFILEQKFGAKGYIPESLRMAINILALYKGRQVSKVTKWANGKIQIETDLDGLVEKIPGSRQAIREMLGEKLWRALMSDSKIVLDFGLQTIKEQLPKDI